MKGGCYVDRYNGNCGRFVRNRYFGNWVVWWELYLSRLISFSI